MFAFKSGLKAGNPWLSEYLSTKEDFVKKCLSTLAIIVAIVNLAHVTFAADEPSVLIVGKWKDRSEPDDAVIEFAKDGKGRIVDATQGQSSEVNISWKITDTIGNACIVVITYDVPQPNELEPLTWLIAFDGENTFVCQPAQNKIVFMDRQK